MSAASPTAFLLWSILSSVFFCFLLVHLWLYDRFHSLRFWTVTSHPGAFKRIMTYSYLLTVPTLVFFSIAMTILKYREGWLLLSLANQETDGARRRPGPMPIERQAIIPRPYLLWSTHSQAVAVPMFFVFAQGWSLEVVTHLEELSFWLFLLHQGPKQRDWFTSWEFRLWAGGSLAAVVGFPVTVASTKTDLEKCFAWIFLIGSSASTFTTVLFLYILFRFPIFLRRIKMGGADVQVITTLSTFYKLNVIRVLFRFVYTIPLLILAVDALHGPHDIVKDQFWSDLLLILGGIGCFASSAITLLIFFPRPSATANTVDKPAPPLSHVSSHVLAWRQHDPHLFKSNGQIHGNGNGYGHDGEIYRRRRDFAGDEHDGIHTDSIGTMGSSFKRLRRASAPPVYTSQNEEHWNWLDPSSSQQHSNSHSNSHSHAHSHHHQQQPSGSGRGAGAGAGNRGYTESVASSGASWIGSRADPDERSLSQRSVDLSAEEYGEGGIPLHPYITKFTTSIDIQTTPIPSPEPSERHRS